MRSAVCHSGAQSTIIVHINTLQTRQLLLNIAGGACETVRIVELRKRLGPWTSQAQSRRYSPFVFCSSFFTSLTDLGSLWTSFFGACFPGTSLEGSGI